MKNNNQITILSCGIGTKSIPAHFADIVKNCKTIVGGKRLLELFPDFTGEKIPIDKNVRTTIANLAKKNCKTVILASGDALFHGIAKTVLDIIPEERVKIIPNITAAQALCAKLAIPWHDASFFSIHGREDIDMPWEQISDAKLAIIYGDNKCNAANLAEKLIKKDPETSESNAAIGSDLGLDSEKITTGTLGKMAKEQCSGLSILIVMNKKERPAENKSTNAPLGRPDDEYVHRNNMITHSEVRAVVLSKLELCPGIMWDIGAGSGSVGIEAAGLQPGLTVYSIEKNETRMKDIKTNISKFKTENIVPLHGNALEIISKIPNPDIIFIGGGGEDISEILHKSFERLNAGGTIVATAVLLETRTALANTLKDKCKEVVSIAVSRSKTIGNSRLMKSENNIEIFVYKKRIH